MDRMHRASSGSGWRFDVIPLPIPSPPAAPFVADLTRVGNILADDWRQSQEDYLHVAEGDFCGTPVDDAAAIAMRSAAAWERELVAINARAGLVARPFVANWPALARWRDGVLREPRRHTVPIVAAALEALALECDVYGHPELAQQSRREAERLVLAARA